MDWTSKDVLEPLLTGAFSLVAALVALLGVTLTSYFTSRNNKANVFAQVVTQERAKWRELLRQEASEFVTLSYDISDDKDTDGTKISRLRQLKALIKFRLNPDPSHKLDNLVTTAIDTVVAALSSQNADRAVLEVELATLESSVQRLLKQEWEKSKFEAKAARHR